MTERPPLTDRQRQTLRRLQWNVVGVVLLAAGWALGHWVNRPLGFVVFWVGVAVCGYMTYVGMFRQRRS